jgi:hypothetical protein
VRLEAVRLVLHAGRARREVVLAAHLDAGAREAAAADANAWIKRLRLARVGEAALRDRFHYRGDSLWWFTELYLHKEGAARAWHEAVRAAAACLDAHAPERVEIVSGPPDLAWIVARVAGARGVPAVPGAPPLPAAARRASLALRSRYYTWSAHLSPRRLRPRPVRRADVLAFVHSAFWRRPAAEAEGGGEEGYIGPVLDAIEARVGRGQLALVGVGPRVNFRARRWWHPLAAAGRLDALPIVPIEAVAGRAAIRPSLAVWRARRDMAAALLGSRDLREAARVDGHDLWPLVRLQLLGAVLLQWPWSARAMDEAGAALDRIAPKVVVTYAEAGGWGRAIVLEARRRGVPVVGLQHGFIYRHWLNYLHEPDEMAPSAAAPADRGFPRPDLTLLFDRHAEEHLRTAGHFPAEALRVTGSPRLDALVEAAARLSPADLEAVRRRAGAAPEARLVLVASKHAQIGRVFPALVEAARRIPDVYLIVKCHPAEVPDPYLADARGFARVSVAPASTDLAALIAASRAIVTVNSTVALDALVLGVPTLVVDLPNNLSPFVEAGVMAGATAAEAIEPMLRAIVDEGAARRALLERRAAFLARYAIGCDGGAARRAADAVLELMRPG